MHFRENVINSTIELDEKKMIDSFIEEKELNELKKKLKMNSINFASDSLGGEIDEQNKRI